jgi:hypothetical protein
LHVLRTAIGIVLVCCLAYSSQIKADSHTYDSPFQWIEKAGEAEEQALDPQVGSEIETDLDTVPAEQSGADKARTDVPEAESSKEQAGNAARPESAAGSITSSADIGAGKPRTHANGQSLAAQASDPTAPLIQVQTTYFYAPSNHNADGYSSLLNFQPVMPIPKSELIPIEQVMRLTVPVLTTPKPNRETGLGDINYFDIFVPGAEDWGVWGAGFTAVLPTASDDELGAGKFQLGPALTAIYYKKTNWQIGAIVQNPVSVAGDGHRDDVAVLQLQPVVNYLHGDWYYGAGDFNITWDWKEDEATIPVAFQAGAIKRIGKYKYNLSAEVVWNAVHPDDAITPRWGVRLGFVWLLPED